MATFAPVPSATSTVEVRDRVREAISRRRALRVVGGSSWLDANRPVRAESTLVTSGLSGVVEYEPGDLTITVRAGTTLDEIAHATMAQGQWLTLDPHGDSARATIGATIATASFGPLAHQFGTPRDVTLGVEFVTGAGDVVRGGGRVVKNVAGFDLTRLITGSWGSLGVVTEATLRLRAIPPTEATLAISLGDEASEIERSRARLRALPFVPLAAEAVDATLARALSLGGSTLLIRLGGNEEAVAAQRQQLANLGAAHEVEPEIWRRFRSSEPRQATVLRISRLPSLFTTTWREARRCVEQWPNGYCHGDPGRGIARIVLPLSADVTDAAVRAVLDVPFDGGRVYERLPANLWDSLAPTAMHRRLERDVKAKFDPHALLNPGIFGEMQ
jgi:glycolate oxidase FAD binding subunit